MPIDTHLPYKVLLYLEIIDRLTRWHDGFDSNSPEHKIFESEIEHYLDAIRKELAEVKEE